MGHNGRGQYKTLVKKELDAWRHSEALVAYALAPKPENLPGNLRVGFFKLEEKKNAAF